MPKKPFFIGVLLGLSVLGLMASLWRGVVQETTYTKRAEMQPVIDAIRTESRQASQKADAVGDKAERLLAHHQKEVDIRSREMVLRTLQSELRQWRRMVRLRNDPATKQYELDQLRELEAMVRRAEIAYQADVAELVRMHHQ